MRSALISTETSLGETSAQYDLGGRVKSATNTKWFVTKSEYDHHGRVTRSGAVPTGQADPIAWSEYACNNLGWRLKVQDADGFTTACEFEKRFSYLSGWCQVDPVQAEEQRRSLTASVPG